jgi:outer membrane protein TolC
MRRARIILVTLLIAWSAVTARSITLDALLQTTIEKNPEIQQARHNLEAAAGRRLVFRSVGLPDATIGVVGGDEGGHRAGQKRNQPFGFGYGGLKQAFFNAAVPASFRRGDVEILVAQQQLNVAVVEQLHAARMAFYTAIYNRSLKGVRVEQRKRLEENISSQKERYQSGLADRSAFVGAEVQTRELDPRVEAAQRTYDGAILQLAAAIGANLGPGATLPEPEGEVHYVTFDPDMEAETGKALENRPDLKLARLLVRAANEDQRIIEAAYYPVVNAVVEGEYIPVSSVRRTHGQGTARPQDDVVSSELRAGAAYTWRVVDNGKTYGAVLQQQSARKINEILLHKLEMDVPRDMLRIRQDLDAIAAKREPLAGASSAAEENAITVQQNLAQGVVSQYEFRLAQNALLDVRSQLLTLAYQQNLALAEWDRATGRYFRFFEDRSQNVR